jgi:putative phosphoesterase
MARNKLRDEMDIALIADLHGNSYAFESILEFISYKKIEKIILAGDIIGGPNPNKTIDLVKNNNISVIIGNQEQYLFDQLKDPNKYNSKRWDLITTVNNRVSQENIEYLKTLPEIIRYNFNKYRILVTHSTPTNSNEVFYPEKNENRGIEILQNIDEDIYICGHSHRQWFRKYNKTTAINPGSAGFPIGQKLKAPFSILHIDRIITVDHYQIDYTSKGFIDEFKEENFFNSIGPMGKAIYYTLLSGNSVLMDFLSFIFKSNNSSCYNDFKITDSILLQADKKFNWEKYNLT